MNIIEPSFKILHDINGERILKNIERIARVCYKSEKHITDESYKAFIRNIINSGHESVIEHEKVTIKLICDRGISHEIVRHRLASYSQESTRYCNYNQEKFGKELTFIRPYFWKENSVEFELWKNVMQNIEYNYMKLIELGAKPEEARSILPNSLKTEVVITMNLREWRHFFKLRTSKKAHPQMREIAIPLLKEMQDILPVIFDDICVCN